MKISRWLSVCLLTCLFVANAQADDSADDELVAKAEAIHQEKCRNNKYNSCIAKKDDCGEGQKGSAAEKKMAACVRACLAEEKEADCN